MPSEGLPPEGERSTRAIGPRRLDDDRFEDFSEDAGMAALLTALGEEGMASGVSEAFDIDSFIEDVRQGR